jgi:8-oxo-dGTP pyrophosphatase MutT (NUDIX family)
MAEEVSWQIFKLNGTADSGRAMLPEEARGARVNVGASHVWAWSRTNDDGGVWLQRRAKSKAIWPGRLDISFAGHIDEGETPLEAAVRESFEETGYRIDPEELVYIFSYWNPESGTKWVYACEVPYDVSFSFNDGEVENMIFVSLDEFTRICQRPEDNGLVPHSSEYFSFVIKALRILYEGHESLSANS